MITIIHELDGSIITDEPEEKTTDYNVLRHAYAAAFYKPHYPMPAILHHLDQVAAEPMQAWEDFKAIGWHGSLDNYRYR